MVRKLIAFSFEPESIGGFAIVCNGVHMGRNGAFSHCYPLTKSAFLEAMKDRIKFNELLGIDIREGWQNALADAIAPFTTMTEDADPAVLADAVAKADINIRGEEEVAKDVEVLEVENKKLVAEVEKEIKPAKKATKKTTKKKEVKDDEGRTDTVATISEDDGCSEGDGVSAEEPSTADNA
jgi:hypothetical protein